MDKRIVFVALSSGLLFAIGCASGPSSNDATWESMEATQVSRLEESPFRRPIRTVANPRMTSEVARLQSQLQRGGTADRIDAITRLGQLAAAGSNDSFHSIELLTSSMRSDGDMGVRMAATEALSGIEDPNATKPLDSLVPTAELPEEPPVRFSMLKSIWQR